MGRNKNLLPRKINFQFLPELSVKNLIVTLVVVLAIVSVFMLVNSSKVLPKREMVTIPVVNYKIVK